MVRTIKVSISSKGLKIIIDPYLSDFVASIVPEIFKKTELNSI